MFFDEPRQDDTYLEILSAIAKKQREVLDCRFNWQKRAPIIQKKRSFFGRGNADTVYQQRLLELEKLKMQAQEHRCQMGYGSGTFWWNLPWSQIEEYLIYDLQQENEVGNWRFEREWQLEQMDDRTVLLLHEEGHCSEFSTSTSFDTGIISSYSQDEIDSRIRDFGHMMNTFDMAELAFSDNRPVQSYLTGAEYDSTADYMLSAEHYLVRSHMKEQYAHSLYTETETTSMYVSGNSRHYEALFAVAEFHVSGSGTLEQLGINNYQLCAKRGSVPDDISELYASRDAAVSCAAFLADYENVKHVPLKLFGNDIKEGAVNFQEALRQAELYTCLAEKL